MIFIRTDFNGIILHDKESVVIYDVDEGYPNDYCEYADIVFETVSMKVTYKQVYHGAEWCERILDYIHNHVTEENIIVNLDHLVDGEDFVTKGLDVTTKD